MNNVKKSVTKNIVATVVTTKANMNTQLKLLKTLLLARNKINKNWKANYNNRKQPKFIIKSRFDYSHTQQLYIRLQNIGVDTFAFPTYESAVRFRMEHREDLLKIGDLI